MTQTVVETALELGGRPPSPGEFIQEDILDEYCLTQKQLAERLGVSRRSVNELITERRAVSTEMAMRLSELTGQTPDYWLNLQRQFDVWKLREKRLSFNIVPLDKK